MPKLDVRAEIAADLQPRLAPGETIRATERVTLTGGKDERSNPALANELRALFGRPSVAVPLAAAGVIGSAFTLVSPFNGPTGNIDARINGVAIAGDTNSVASAINAQLGSVGDTFLTVTDQRMFVVGDRHGSAQRMRSIREQSRPLPYEVLGEVGPAQLASARLKPVLINRGRIEFYFTDGSMLAVFTVPQFTTSHANNLLTALGATS